jgi:hypothetical protein
VERAEAEAFLRARVARDWKRGGQHGHEGRSRRLLPAEQVDKIVEHWPDRRRWCAHVFVERQRVVAAEPSRRQVAELSPIAVRVTAHRLLPRRARR